jgi:phosphoribosylformimino-5-aminoimidazole carboxamide ribotide isomerase
VVDLDGAKAGKPVNLDVVAEIVKAVSIPVETGGGYRMQSEIEAALAAGIFRVIIGSRAFEDITFASDCFDKFGEKIIFSFDAKNFIPQVRGWEESLNVDIFDVLRRFISFGVREIIYTDVSRDGTLSGPAVDNINRILDEVDINMISAGGIKNIGDIRELLALEKKGLTGIIVGRALYEGTLDLREAISACEENNTVS